MMAGNYRTAAEVDRAAATSYYQKKAADEAAGAAAAAAAARRKKEAKLAATPTTNINAPKSIGDLTAIADPWASQRGQYQSQLSELMKNPGGFINSDLFKASTNAGIDAVNRSAAASGMLKSGNRMTALMDYSQKNAPDNFFRMADLLSGFAGAKAQNPGGGLSAAANLQNANTSQYNAETSRLNYQAGRDDRSTAYNDQWQAQNDLKKQLQDLLNQQALDKINNWSVIG